MNVCLVMDGFLLIASVILVKFDAIMSFDLNVIFIAVIQGLVHQKSYQTILLTESGKRMYIFDTVYRKFAILFLKNIEK